jgi:hypothetical protein
MLACVRQVIQNNMDVAKPDYTSQHGCGKAWLHKTTWMLDWLHKTTWMWQTDYTRQHGRDSLITQDNMVVTKPDSTRQHGCYRLITQDNLVLQTDYTRQLGHDRLITQDNLGVTDWLHKITLMTQDNVSATDRWHKTTWCYKLITQDNMDVTNWLLMITGTWCLVEAGFVPPPCYLV